jgi:hypothetical protein
MNLEHALHAHWSACRPLADLVPPSRLFTGLARGEPDLPSVTLDRPGDQPPTHTSSGHTLAAARFRFDVWDDQLDRAHQVAQAIAACFDRAAFAGCGGRVLDCLPLGRSQQQHPAGRWQLALDYLVRAQFDTPPA